MITRLIEFPPKAYRTHILTAGAGLPLVIFNWKIAISQAQFSLFAQAKLREI
jgi:hypothetical protein